MEGTSWPGNKLGRERVGRLGTTLPGNGLVTWEQLGQGTGWGERVGQEQVAGNELGVNQTKALRNPKKSYVFPLEKFQTYIYH